MFQTRQISNWKDAAEKATRIEHIVYYHPGTEKDIEEMEVLVFAKDDFLGVVRELDQQAFLVWLNAVSLQPASHWQTSVTKEIKRFQGGLLWYKLYEWIPPL